MTLVKLRMEAEREIRLLLTDQTEAERPLAIGPMLAELQRLDMLPQTADRFRSALQIMNRAVHGLDVAPGDAKQPKLRPHSLPNFERSAIDSYREVEHSHRTDAKGETCNALPSISLLLRDTNCRAFIVLLLLHLK